MSTCTVTVPLLQIHVQPDSNSPVHQTVHAGTTLAFVKKVQGAMVHLNSSNNANWGQSPDDLFFPLAGTDHPNG